MALRSATRERYLSAPVGRFVRGRTWISAAPSTGLYVTLLAGRPRVDELRELGRTYAVRTGRHEHAVLFDGSRVEAVDPGAHDVLVEQFTRGAERYARHLARVAVVHGRGVVGSLFAGYPKVIGLRCEWRCFVSTDAALRWLGASSTTRDDVRSLALSLTRDASERAVLTAILDERPETSLAEAARTLAMAPRSLQRMLATAGTSFRDEVDAARWSRASRALARARGSITEIALDAGFASLQAFSVWFRARAGESPRRYRARATRSG